MASRTKARRRAPLMESDTEAALRRRGSELVGLVLLAVAGLAWAMVWTYSPNDPSLFSATDEAPRNALGLVGASLADPLHRALGWAAYGIPAGVAIWGLRLVLHTGEGRLIRRTVAATRCSARFWLAFSIGEARSEMSSTAASSPRVS